MGDAVLDVLRQSIDDLAGARGGSGSFAEDVERDVSRGGEVARTLRSRGADLPRPSLRLLDDPVNGAVIAGEARTEGRGSNVRPSAGSRDAGPENLGGPPASASRQSIEHLVGESSLPVIETPRAPPIREEEPFPFAATLSEDGPRG